MPQPTRNTRIVPPLFWESLRIPLMTDCFRCAKSCGLPLKAELVTLSACDTNVGTAEGEAGVVSLEQAFLIAGARAVVASLWNVEDRSTTVLMKAFYTHLAEHEDKALALTHAKRDMLEHYGDPSPYYWAPFVMVGEGAQPVSFGR